MDATNAAGRFPLGAFVKIRNSGFRRAKIVELLGPLAPGGKLVYRVMFRGKPNPAYVVVREDQLELIPAES